MFSTLRSRTVATTLLAAGVSTGFALNPASSDKNTAAQLTEIAEGVNAIKANLGVSSGPSAPKVDPIGNFPLLTDKHKSLSCKVMKQNPEVYAICCNKKTPMGFTFDQAIQAGLDAPHLGVGVSAGEAAAYTTFKEMMDPVIEGWHGYKPTDTHTSDMDYTKLNMTPSQTAKFDKHVVSTRIRAGRSVETLALPPATDRKQRRKVESLLVGALANMEGELAGKYFPLGGMTKAEEDKMQGEGFLFQKPTPNNVLANCGAGRDWPDGRGIYHNVSKTFLVWVNEEDHMRCISMRNGGNVKEVFALFARAIGAVEKSLNKSGFHYSHDEHLGYITTCPSNIGTGMRASVMLKLPKLHKKMGVHALEELCDGMGLQARGGRGEHSPPGPNGEFDISNKGRVGASEVQLIQRMIDGVDKLIDLEEAL
jgi:creatine kinase